MALRHAPLAMQPRPEQPAERSDDRRGRAQAVLNKHKDRAKGMIRQGSAEHSSSGQGASPDRPR
jgi:hypothetical protein